MIDWIFIGFGIIIVPFYYIFKQFQKIVTCVLLIENNTEENEIPPSYEEAVQNTE